MSPWWFDDEAKEKPEARKTSQVEAGTERSLGPIFPNNALCSIYGWFPKMGDPQIYIYI